MPYQDFRQFLDVLRQQGELIDVDRPIALADIGKAMKQSYKRQGPAIQFNETPAAPCRASRRRRRPAKVRCRVRLN